MKRLITLALAFALLTPFAAWGDDRLSVAALVGAWEASRSSVNTEYGFSDDGYFYKNTRITTSHLSSIYHPSETTYSGNYRYYKPGWTEFRTSYTTTYLDTLVGVFRVRGGVIEFDDVTSVPHVSFTDDWYYAKKRTPESAAKFKEYRRAAFRDDFEVEFEFISPTRLRLRAKDSDMDYFWDLRDTEHNVKVPTHTIAAAKWPAKNLSPQMPAFKTKGRIREAGFGDSEADKKAPDEYKTVSVIIDKADAVADMEAYYGILKSSGWWVEEEKNFKKGENMSFEARKGMYKLNIRNGHGSGTYADTIAIESVKCQRGEWPPEWSGAGLAAPDNSAVLGDVANKKDDDRDIRETVVFDSVDERGVKAYSDKLVKAGFKKPEGSGQDWELMKYIRIGKDLYRTNIRLDRRMGAISSFNYDLKYTPDGVWPESWTAGGLPAPDGRETIAGALNMESWEEDKKSFGSFYGSVKFLGLDKQETDAYFKRLEKDFGFKQQDGYDETNLYRYLRIDGALCRVEIQPNDNDEIAEVSYRFRFSPEGQWPESWIAAGLPAPNCEAIFGAIDMEYWEGEKKDFGSFYGSVKFLGMDEKTLAAYWDRLKSSGFRQTDGYDETNLYRYLRIDGALCRVEISPNDNDELTEVSYRFRFSPEGQWPESWTAAGLPAPNCEAIFGEIDMEYWEGEKKDFGSFYGSVKFLGADEKTLAAYWDRLKSSGFRQTDGYDETNLYRYLRIDGVLCRVEVQPNDNNELTEVSYRFRFSPEGQWPGAWRSAGVPKPECQAIFGEIDMESWDDDLGYGYHSQSVRFLDADMDAYSALLKKNGFTVPEDSYSDTWELGKRVKIGGKWFLVNVEDSGNAEIPEANFRFRVIEE